MMKMAVESMEMAPRAIPYPDRVPEQRLLCPQNWSSIAAALRNFSWMDANSFRVSRRREFIGGRVMSEGVRGAHITRWRG
jgi:hypothetical protein